MTAAAETADAAVVAVQLGRQPRGVFSVAHRCPCGLPDVIQTAPRLPDGTPFPTLYYLTCPHATAAMSKLEASGLMRDMTRRLAEDPALRRRQQAASRHYVTRRDAAAIGAGIQPLPPGTPSAGGMPDRVKCLHALAAHELACSGTNALGREAIQAAGTWWAAGRCVPIPAPGDPPAAGDPCPAAGSPAAGSRRPMSDDPRRGGRAGSGAAGAVRVAAIDCGTNSLRLLVADASPGEATLADLVRRMEIVRLGQGVDSTGRLGPEALARTFGVLEEYAGIVRDASVSAVRMVATSATRDAANSAEFVSGVTRILGVPPEVLTGDQEASLSFTGATAELGQPAGRGQPPGPQLMPPPYLVVDIGGGSTEFVLGGDQAGGLAAASVDIGCVRMTERHLRSDPPADAEIAAATADIDAAIGRAVATVPAQRARTLVGLAGSVTTVAGIALDLPAYDPDRIHHARISAAEVHAVARMLLSQTRAQRAQIPVMHPGRVDVIGAGALVLDRIMTRLGFAEVVASEHDILDGIAWSLVDSRAG